MQKITVIAVGGLKEKYLRDALGEYQKRLSALCDFSVHEISECKLPATPSDSEITHGLCAEGERILSAIPDGCDIVALCIEGKQMSSPELAQYIENSASGGKRGVCFIIGGSYGLSDEVKNKASLRLSVSKMTFPHQLFRILLTEQIYRAFSITAGGKYHK